MNITGTATEQSKRFVVPLVILGCLTAVVIPLSIAAPAVAVPYINHALGGTAMELSWIINAYILTYGSATLAAGSLADSYGRKRVWLWGMLLFAVVTAAIPLMPSVFWIDILRLIQGLGAAAGFAGAMAALTQEFSGHARTRVFSFIGTTFGVGAAFGPFLAGLLIDTLGWKWVFFLPAAVALIAVCLITLVARETRDPEAQGLDWWGAISFTLGLALLTYGVILAPEQGWGSVSVLACLLAALMLLAVFVWVERGQAKPMLDLSLFAHGRFLGVQVLALAPAYAYIVLLVILPARFIGVEGYSALQAGQMMVALSAPLLVVPVLAGVLARWVSVGVLSAIGLFIAALGLLALGWTLGDSDMASYRLWAMLLIGIGIGLPWGLMDGLAVSVVPKERAGMATGIFNAVRLAGDGMALALVGAFLSAQLFSGLQYLTESAVVGFVSQSDILAAANRMAMSDLQNALLHWPVSAQKWLLQVYEGAFQGLLFVLAGAAAVTALIVWLLLGRVDSNRSER